MPGQRAQVGVPAVEQRRNGDLRFGVQFGKVAIAGVFACVHLGSGVIAVAVAQFGREERFNNGTHPVLGRDQVKGSSTVGPVRVQ